jgi:PKD repeat protein
MEALSPTKNKKRWLPLLLLAIGMFCAHAIWACSASFTYSIGAGGNVTFTSTSTGLTAGTKYTWITDGGSVFSTTSSTFTHLFTYNGTYIVMLYLADSAGVCSSYTSDTLTITNSGTCNLAVSFTSSVGANGQVTFTNTSTGTTSKTQYQWYFGDGIGGSTSASPTYTYPKNGNYTVALHVENIDSNGVYVDCTDSIEQSVIVTNDSNPSCNLSASFTYTVGANGHIDFTSTSNGMYGYVNYTWNPGDGSGTNYNNQSTYSHVYTANGTYYVILTINSDSSSCTSTDTMVVNVTNVGTNPCTLSANFVDTVASYGNVYFTSTSTGTNAGTEYFWNPGDGSPTTQGSATYSHTYYYQGNYIVWLYVRDTGSAYCQDSIEYIVSATSADSNACHLHANFSYSIGANGHVAFTNTSTSISPYLNSIWNFGDGSGTPFTGNSSFNHIYTANGTYTVTLTTEADSNYCSDTISKLITITNVTIPCTLSASFTIVNDSTTGQVQLTSTSTGTYAGTQYYWKNSDSVAAISGGSSYTTTYSANGSYNVWLIIKDTGSAFCADSISQIVNVSNVDSLHASFTTTPISDTLGNYGYEFISTSTGTNDNTVYAWNPGDSTAGDTGVNQTTYVHYYHYTGVHTVTLSIWFASYPMMPHKATGTGNIRYDFSTYSMQVNVGNPTGIETISDDNASSKLYPNPNNGEFKLAISNVENTGNINIEVTNILGEVVYQTTASVSNGGIVKDINLQNAPNGTYFVRVITANKVYNTKTVINR